MLAQGASPGYHYAQDTTGHEHYFKEWNKEKEDVLKLKKEVERCSRGAWVQGQYPTKITDQAWDLFERAATSADKRAQVQKWAELPYMIRQKKTAEDFAAYMSKKAKTSGTYATLPSSLGSQASSSSTRLTSGHLDFFDKCQ